MTKHALVTGGNSGIGFAVAEALGKAGYRLWITGRNSTKGTRAAEALRTVSSAGVDFLAADFSRAGDVARLVKAVKAKCEGRLDALVHSTGVLNAKRVVSADGLEETWASQFLGRYLLTEALTPELSASEDGRVVFVGAPLMKSARLHEDVTLPNNYSVIRAAQQSQLACQLYIQSYAAAHPGGPAINGGHVGIVASDIFRGMPGPLRPVFRLVTPIIGITAARAAKNFVALASDPTLKGVTGCFFPKPERLDKRNALAFTAAQQEELTRVLAKFSDARTRALAA